MVTLSRRATAATAAPSAKAGPSSDGQQLVDRHVVEAGQPLQARHRDGPLAPLVGAEHRRLELLARGRPRPPAATAASGGGSGAGARRPSGRTPAGTSAPVGPSVTRHLEHRLTSPAMPTGSPPDLASGGRDAQHERPDHLAVGLSAGKPRRHAAVLAAFHVRPEPPARCAGRPAARRRRWPPSPTRRTWAPSADPGRRPAPAPRRSSRPRVRPAPSAWRQRRRLAAPVGQGHGRRRGRGHDLGEGRPRPRPRAARQRRDCMAASRATRPRRSAWRRARSASHRTTERAAANGTIRSTPELGQLLHDQLGPLALHQGEADRERRGRRRHRRSDLADRLDRRRRSGTRRQRAAPVGARSARRPARSRSTRSRWWRSSSSSTGASRSATKTCGADRPPGPARGQVAAPATGTPSGSWTTGRCRPARPPRPATRRSARSSSSCSSVRSVGVSTTTWTSRSPRPRPSTWGTPRPRRRNTRPVWVPRGIDEVLGAVERLEREVRAERGLGHRQVQLVAPGRSRGARSGRGAAPARGRRGRPMPPPRGPTAPRPVSRSVEPVSMPAGTSTV